MPNFFALPPEVKRRLVAYFEGKPVGTKIKYGFTVQGIAGEVGNYTLKNSYIKLENDVYALGRGQHAIVGEGAFGKVKYIQSLSRNNLYVVKIVRCNGSTSDLNDLQKEINALYDVGLYRDGGQRKLQLRNKQYLVMLNAGMSLEKYLQPKLKDAERYDIAIKVCWLVHNLHRGNASRTDRSYAHRDLKPLNIAINGDVVRLIDFGLCQVNPDQFPDNPSGAPAYLPNINTFLTQKPTLRQLDVLALKRVLYMPDKMLCFTGYVEGVSRRYFGIFPQVLLHASGLAKYFDTSATSKTQTALSVQNFQGTPLLFASLLVLSRYGLMERYAEKMNNPTLAYAVLGLYFANLGIADGRVAAHIASAINAYVLCRVAPRYGVLAEKMRLLASLVATGIINNLHEALEHKSLIALIKSPSALIQRAATLLWQNGVYEPLLLIQLKRNEALAPRVIKFIFDGDLPSAKHVLLPLAPPKSVKPLLGVKRLSLPMIPLAKVQAQEPKSKSERALVPRKNDSVVSNKAFALLPPLFFARPQQDKKPYTKRIEHAYQGQLNR